MTTLKFEYLSTKKNKYAIEKDTENYILEDIDFTLTLKEHFDTLKSSNKDKNFKEAIHYYFIYLGKICDINKSLNTLNIPENGTIMILNKKEEKNIMNSFVTNLLNLFTSANSLQLEYQNNILNMQNEIVPEENINYEISDQDYEIYKNQLETLESMGFIEKETNIHALKRNNGDINMAIEWIVGLN